MANSNFLTDLTTQTYNKFARKDLVDNIFTSNALLYLMQKQGSYTPLDGGVKILEPVMYAETSGAKAYSGYELLTTNSTQVSTNAEFNWRSYAAPIVISGEEEDLNMGEAQVINLVKGRIFNAQETIKGLLNAHLYNTAVGGSDGKQLDGIGIMIDSTGTYGNINPTTDTWWASTESAFVANLVDELSTVYFSVSKGATDKPNLGVTTQAVYEQLFQEIDPVLQLTDTSMGDVGFENIKFRGMTVVFDEDCTSQTFYFINTKYVKLYYHKAKNFEMRPMQSPVNQDSMLSHIIWRGALTCSARKRQAKLTGIS